MTHLALAESELKNYQVYFIDLFSQSMKDQGAKPQVVSDKYMTDMGQHSHTMGAKAKSRSTADSPPSTLPRTQLAASTDLAPHTDPVSLGPHVVRVDTRLASLEKMMIRLSEQVTMFKALDPPSPAVSSTLIAVMQNQLASTPIKHGVPFRNRSNAPPPPRKRLKMLKNSAIPAAATSPPVAVAAQPPAAACEPTFLSTQVLPSPDSLLCET